MTDDEKAALETIKTELQLSWTDQLRLWVALGVVKKKGPRMKEILEKLWSDPAYFTAALRAFLGLLCNAILSGQINFPGKAGVFAWHLAQLWPLILAVPAGQTNKSTEEIKEIAGEACPPGPPPRVAM